ncbi:MAG: YkgJ family cysteine cluster protein [Meiothermus sp.]
MQALRQAVSQAHAELDRRSAAYLRTLALQPSCRKGCYFCCYALVMIGLAEAEYLRENLSPERLAQVEQTGRERLRQIARGKHRPNFATSYFLQANPCPLLTEDGACSAHAHRPLACRGVLTDLDAHYCTPGAVLNLRGRAKDDYEDQLRSYHGPEHYLKTPWLLSEQTAQGLWETEQKVRGFTVIGELATLVYLRGQDDFQTALRLGPEATRRYLQRLSLLGGDWGFWVG